MRRIDKPSNCPKHPKNHRPYDCEGCSVYHRAYRKALEAVRFEEAGKVRARLKAKPKTPEQRMDETTWEQWTRRKPKYSRWRRDREIQEVYQSEVFPRGFRTRVPMRFDERSTAPKAFYPLHGLLKDAA